MNPNVTGKSKGGVPAHRRTIDPERHEFRRERKKRAIPSPEGCRRNFGASLFCLMVTLCVPLAQAGADSLPESSRVPAADITKVTIQASHMGWGSTKAKLTLVRSNALFVGAGHSVPEAVISNLWTALLEAPRASIDPTDLGLSPAWLEANRDPLLKAFGGQTGAVLFPLASPRQRGWLTNAVLDPKIMGDLVRGNANRSWTDDYPEMKIGLYSGDREIAQLHSKAQTSFMLPWEVTLGTRQHQTYQAGISRGIASLLPAGFLNRERIQGNLLSIVTTGFADHPTVQKQIKQMTMDETLGDQKNRFFREFAVKRYWMPAGSYGRFPDTWMATLHRTNWPARLTMPVRSHVEQGVVPLLLRLLDGANDRVQPILLSPWLVGVIQGEGQAAIEVAPEGSMAEDAYLRGHMAKVGLGEFYDEIKPLMEQGLAFTLREQTGIKKSRTSEWILSPSGKLVLVKFAGDGVLGWTPQELGFKGRAGELGGISFNMVGVFLTHEGRIEKVIPQATR